MYYIGLDVHKRTISYCVKDTAGHVHQEGKERSGPPGASWTPEREQEQGDACRSQEDGRLHGRSGAQETGLRAYGKTQRHCRLRENLPRKEKYQDHPLRRLPGPACDGLSDGGKLQRLPSVCFGTGENTNSIFCADSLESQIANGCPVLQRAGTTSREAPLRNHGF